MDAFGNPVTSSFRITNPLLGNDDYTSRPIVASLSNGNAFVAYSKFLSFSDQDFIRGRIMNSNAYPFDSGD